MFKLRENEQKWVLCGRKSNKVMDIYINQNRNVVKVKI